MRAGRQHFWFGAVLMALLLAACSSEPQVAAEVLPATTAPTPTAVSPDPTPTATPPPPTPTALPEPTPTPYATAASTPTLSGDEFFELATAELDAIRTVHNRFMTELLEVDEREPGDVARFVELVEELTFDVQRDEMLKRLEERQERQEFLVGSGYESNPESIDTLVGGTVRVYDCSRDQSSILGADGAIILESTGEYSWRSTDLRRINDQWRVVLFITDWEEQCDPA